MKMDIVVIVNGRKYEARVEPRLLLSDFLRDTPEQDRLWFEQQPPRDFDFDK